MYEMNLDPWYYCHEIGHGIIAFLYHQKYYTFEGITFDPKRISEIGLNPQDKGYTLSFPVDNLDELIKDDIRHPATIDGLLLLAGIAGSTYLPPAGQNEIKKFNDSDFMSVLHTEGSEGDFEIINRRRRPYGKLLFNNDEITDQIRNEIHCDLLKVLEEIFLMPEIQNSSKQLFNKLTESGNLHLTDFQEHFDLEMIKKIKENIENLLGTQ